MGSCRAALKPGYNAPKPAPTSVIAPAMEGRMNEIEMNRLGFQFSAALMYYSWQSRLLGRFEDKVGPEDDYIRALAKIFGKQGV